MSVLVTSRISGEGGFSAYARYLERPKVAGRERNLAFYSDLGATPDEAIAAAEAIMRGTSRKCWGQSVVHSYADAELAPTEENVSLALMAAYETCQRACPGAPVLQWAQRDGQGGKLHVHSIVLNHDLRSGKSSRGAWAHWQWREHNDVVMTRWAEAGLQVCTPGKAVASSLERTTAARETVGAAADKRAGLSADEVLALSRDAATEWLGEQIDRCADSGALEPLRGLEPPAQLEVPLECGLTLSVWVKKPGKNGKPTATYAVLDDAGESVSTRTGGTGKPTPLRRTQSALDKKLVPGGVDGDRRYAYEALIERISPAPGGLGTDTGIEADEPITITQVFEPEPDIEVIVPGREWSWKQVLREGGVLPEPEKTAEAPEPEPQEPAEPAVERIKPVILTEPENAPERVAEAPALSWLDRALRAHGVAPVKQPEKSAEESAGDRLLRRHGVASNKPSGNGDRDAGD